MDINDLVSHVAEQFVDLGENELGPATEFKTLDSWDSMTALLIISMLDEKYGVTISGDDFRAVKTINDLHTYILSKKK